MPKSEIQCITTRNFHSFLKQGSLKKSRTKLVLAQNKHSHLKGSVSGNAYLEDIGKIKI